MGVLRLCLVFLASLLLVGQCTALRSSREASINFAQHPVQTTVRVVLSGMSATRHASFASIIKSTIPHNVFCFLCTILLVVALASIHSIR